MKSSEIKCSSVLEAMEIIKNDPAKFSYYEQDHILKATFLAVLNYLKAGYKLSDLGWFYPYQPAQ